MLRKINEYNEYNEYLITISFFKEISIEKSLIYQPDRVNNPVVEVIILGKKLPQDKISWLCACLGVIGFKIFVMPANITNQGCFQNIPIALESVYT